MDPPSQGSSSSGTNDAQGMDALTQRAPTPTRDENSEDSLPCTVSETPGAKRELNRAK